MGIWSLLYILSTLYLKIFIIKNFVWRSVCHVESPSSPQSFPFSCIHWNVANWEFPIIQGGGWHHSANPYSGNKLQVHTYTFLILFCTRSNINQHIHAGCFKAYYFFSLEAMESLCVFKNFLLEYGSLQYCVSFCHTGKVNPRYVWMYSLSPESAEWSCLCYTVGSHWLSVLYIVVYRCQSQPPNSLHPFSPLGIHTFVLYICLSWKDIANVVFFIF